jgi:DNA invertase Pin-like site-specific DNA recombinase
MPVMPHASRGNDDRRRPLTILGGLAEFERTLIRARIGEGRGRAKALGVGFGRPSQILVARFHSLPTFTHDRRPEKAVRLRSPACSRPASDIPGA